MCINRGPEIDIVFDVATTCDVCCKFFEDEDNNHFPESDELCDNCNKRIEKEIINYYEIEE